MQHSIVQCDDVILQTIERWPILYSSSTCSIRLLLAAAIASSTRPTASRVGVGNPCSVQVRQPLLRSPPLLPYYAGRTAANHKRPTPAQRCSALPVADCCCFFCCTKRFGRISVRRIVPIEARQNVGGEELHCCRILAAIRSRVSRWANICCYRGTVKS